MELHYFDRKAEYAVVERRLPHWTQPSVVCFITFRTHDSMPKEVASFFDEAAMLKQCESWKHWTARQINLTLGQKGRFWQQDGFEHLVRSEEQFLHFRRYIQRNPVKAGLVEGEFLHYSKPLGSSRGA